LPVNSLCNADRLIFASRNTGLEQATAIGHRIHRVGHDGDMKKQSDGHD
jgi:hypothetical protein